MDNSVRLMPSTFSVCGAVIALGRAVAVIEPENTLAFRGLAAVRDTASSEPIYTGPPKVSCMYLAPL